MKTLSLSLSLLLFNTIAFTQSPNLNFLIRVPDLDKEFHSASCIIDFRSNGSGQSYVRMAIGDVTYAGPITNTSCYSSFKEYPGQIIDAGDNGGGQIVIKCAPSDLVCFKTCSMVADIYPVLYQNDIYVVSTNTLYKGDNLSITQNSSQTQFKLDNCLGVTQNYPPPIMLPCDNVHTFCGDIAGDPYIIGDSYFITCYPSANKCVIVNIDASSDFHCW